MVRLIDLTTEDHPTNGVATYLIKNATTLPVPFSLEIMPSMIDFSHTYTLRAAIFSNGIRFMSASKATIDPGPGRAPVEIAVIPLSGWAREFDPGNKAPSPSSPRQ